MIIAKCYSGAAAGQCLLVSEGPLVGKCEQFSALLCGMHDRHTCEL